MHYSLSVIISVFVLSIINTSALACSCGWGGPFLDAARGADVIVQGTVVSYDRNKHSMLIKITELHSGKIRRKKIRVWGDNGMLCRPYVTTFPVGTEWVFALNGQGSKPGYNPNNKYVISVCGAYWLRIRGNKVIGHINKGRGHSNEKQEITKDVFRRWVRAMN